MRVSSVERGAIRKNILYTEIVMFLVILVFLVLRLILIFRMNVDIDEFSFLSSIFTYIRGELAWPYFTFHVHLFSWLPSLPGDEISWIIAARIAMYVLSLGTCVFLYLTGRLFYHRIGALFSVLSYLSFSNVIEHGTSFRFDPICVFLSIGAVYLIVRDGKSLWFDAVSGLMISIALLGTVKFVFYFVMVVVLWIVLYFMSKNKKKIVERVSVHLFSAIVSAIVLFMAHSYSLSYDRFSGQVEYLVNLSTSGILFGEFFPNRFYIFQAIKENIVPTFFIGIGFACAGLDLCRGRDVKKNMVLAVFIIPVFTLSFYKFSYPYYYNYILVPSIILSGFIPSKAAGAYQERGSMALLIGMVMFYVSVIIGSIGHYQKNMADRMMTQKAVVGAVHKMFSSPVPYIDRCMMISSFPMVGIQMTTWDMERYKENALPLMREILVRKRPVFILANTVILDLSRPWGSRPKIFKRDPLLREDFTLLQQNYIHHWGMIFVAGKRFRFPDGETKNTFEMLIPGIYTVESEEPVWIDGERYPPGAKIFLEIGDHEVTLQHTPAEVAIRWGEDLYLPPYPPPEQPVFFGYYLFGGTDFD